MLYWTVLYGLKPNFVKHFFAKCVYTHMQWFLLLESYGNCFLYSLINAINRAFLFFIVILLFLTQDLESWQL